MLTESARRVASIPSMQMRAFQKLQNVHFMLSTKDALTRFRQNNQLLFFPAFVIAPAILLRNVIVLRFNRI